MDRGPGCCLPRAGALRDGHGAEPAAARAGERLAAVERSILGAAAGLEHRNLPGAAAGGLRALLQPVRSLRAVVVAGVSPGVLAALGTASGGIRLDPLRRP